MENINNSLPVTVKNIKNPNQWSIKIEYQTILLFGKFIDLVKFNNKDLVQIRYINPIRFLVYCRSASVSDISSLNTVLVIPSHYYFIIVDSLDRNIKLYTFENRKNLKFCHESQQLIEINEFSTFHLKWIKEPVFAKKYKNFHSCIMTIGTRDNDNFIKFIRHEDDKQPGYKQIIGLLDYIMQDVSYRLNFTLGFVGCEDFTCTDQIKKGNMIYNVVNIETLDGHAVKFPNFSYLFWRHVMMNIQCTPQLYVPPSDMYTSFEKVLLPFDSPTWIGMCIVFLTGISTVLIVNRLSKNIQDYFYGSLVQTPTLNIFRAFFGIEQTQLPTGSFGRLLLISYIFWCLIMRTAYQGKLFEFVTTAIRKPEIKDLKQLRDKYFTLYFVNETIDYLNIAHLVGESLGLRTQYVDRVKYINIYFKKMQDPSFTGTILTCDLEHELNIFNSGVKIPRRFVPVPLAKSYYGIGFLYQNLWNERFQEIITDLVTGGLIDFYLSWMIKFKLNFIKDHNQIDTGNIVLNLSHLGFGFQICFFTLYAAFLVFLIELIYFRFGKIMNKSQKQSVNEFSVNTELLEVLPIIIFKISPSPEPTAKLDVLNEIDDNVSLFGSDCKVFHKDNQVSESEWTEKAHDAFGPKVENDFDGITEFIENYKIFL